MSEGGYCSVGQGWGVRVRVGLTIVCVWVRGDTVWLVRGGG